MVALAAVVAEDVKAVDDLIESISIEPSLLHKVYVKALCFHHGNEMLIARVIVCLGSYQFASSIAGKTA